MQRDETVETLRANRRRLAAYAVARVAVFGSVACNEATAESDVDILVEFRPDAHIGLFEFARLRRDLEEIPGVVKWISSRRKPCTHPCAMKSCERQFMPRSDPGATVGARPTHLPPWPPFHSCFVIFAPLCAFVFQTPPW